MSSRLDARRRFTACLSPSLFTLHISASACRAYTHISATACRATHAGETVSRRRAAPSCKAAPVREQGAHPGHATVYFVQNTPFRKTHLCHIAQPLSRVSSPSALHLRSKCRVHAMRRRRATCTQSTLQTWSSAPTNTRSSMRSSVACISLLTMYV